MTEPVSNSQPMSEHTPTPWYVGAQNDKLYIITRPPRPSRDDIVDIPDVKVIASMNYCKDGENAAVIVEAVNSHASLKARNEELEAALRTAIRVAGEAREEWDKAPSTMRAGKLLIALSDRSLHYRKDITDMHLVLQSKGGK